MGIDRVTRTIHIPQEVSVYGPGNSSHPVWFQHNWAYMYVCMLPLLGESLAGGVCVRMSVPWASLPTISRHRALE